MRYKDSKKSQNGRVKIVDVWVNADPKKIIEIVPEDIRPYVIDLATSTTVTIQLCKCSLF
ncbi:MAG: hypothetical protein LBP72_05360 [Dysgonamonadaceae bacterium]|nr:hypothetical protein [Dysgonamonadaceae bacterium]